MDVDVQRYYLIQIPLRRDAKGIQLSNMGTPPMQRMYADTYICDGVALPSAAPTTGAGAVYKSEAKMQTQEAPGLGKVAIGHGEAEGAYFTGAGYQGARAEEPIRVTVVYFVTPIGKVSTKDMETFTKAFAGWDSQAIWGGSFVTKESN
jgi:hypothetical protein